MDTYESSGVNLSKSSGLRMMTRTCCADGPFDVIEESYMIMGVHSESSRLYSQRPAIEQKIEIKNLRLGQIKKNYFSGPPSSVSNAPHMSLFRLE